MSGLASALHEFQKNPPVIPKDAENSAFGGKTKHVSLDTLLSLVVPALNAVGLAVSQRPTIVDGQPALRTRLVHAESGEVDEDVMLLLVAKQDPQGQGSGITYARRYSLMATLGLSADADDDGNAATQRRAPGQQPVAAPPKMASQEAVQQVRDLAAAAGYTQEMTEGAIEAEREAHGGVRQAWVDTQLPLLQGAAGVPA